VNRQILVVLAIVTMFGSHRLHAAPANEPEPATASRYTFSWPLDQAASMPRGGSTHGAPVTLDTDDSPGWQTLQTAPVSLRA
jgi:hypothetical protein